MKFYHNPIMTDEILEYLDPQPGGVYVDATLGGGGHFKEIIAKAKGKGIFVGIDQDLAAIEKVESEMLSGDVRLVQDNFKNLSNIMKSENLGHANGIIFDLGVSSFQLDEAKRGFSYMHDAPLDMRMDQGGGISAWEAVNDLPEESLSRIIREYGEESWAKRIAKFICERRDRRTIDTTGELVETIKNAIPAKYRRKGPHPAKRTFQAIRIYVNDELDVLKPSINVAVEVLKKGGRICVISFHSLEDRIVKNVFKELSSYCICPKHSLICNCNHKKTIDILTQKPILPRHEEIKANPRSRSAKLRVAQKI